MHFPHCPRLCVTQPGGKTGRGSTSSLWGLGSLPRFRAFSKGHPIHGHIHWCLWELTSRKWQVSLKWDSKFPLKRNSCLSPGPANWGKTEEAQAFLKSQNWPSSPTFQRPRDPTGSMDLVDILHTTCESMKIRGDKRLKGPGCARETCGAF